MAKKKKIEDPFSYLENFFTSDPNMIHLFNALVRELANSMEEQGKNAELTYGINMTIKNGTPLIEAPNEKQPQIKAQEQETREPLVDVISNEKQIAVIAEVPGADKSDIKLNYTPAVLEISANNSRLNQNYFKQVSLPPHLGSKNIKAKYTNGVLEVIMTKGKKINQENDIKIE